MIVCHVTLLGGEKQTKHRSKVDIDFFVQSISMLKFPLIELKCTKNSLWRSTDSKKLKFKSFWSILFELKPKWYKHIFLLYRNSNEVAHQRGFSVTRAENFHGKYFQGGLNNDSLFHRVTPPATINYWRDIEAIVFYLRPLTTIRSLF